VQEVATVLVSGGLCSRLSRALAAGTSRLSCAVIRKGWICHYQASRRYHIPALVSPWPPSIAYSS